MSEPAPNPRPASSMWRTPVPLIAGALGLLVLLSSLGSPADPTGSAGAVLFKIATSVWAPALMLTAAVGLGRLVSPLFAGGRDPWAVQVGAGLAIHLTAASVLGGLGLVRGAIAQASAVTLTVVGIFMLLQQLSQPRSSGEALGGEREGGASPPPALARWWLLVPGVVILFVAAAMPPSVLWGSEFGGFDALSYHLQLPQEWLARGRLTPLDHNVYSFLPSAMEAEFLHLATLTGAPAPRPGATGLAGLLDGDGWRTLSCQQLHVLTALVAAWLVGRAAAAVLPQGPIADHARHWSPVLVLVTPWTLVSGSLAYNEMPMVALTAAAIVVAAETNLGAWRRGLLAGLLMGGACAVKPTAALLAGPAALVLLLANTPRRAWPVLIGCGLFATILPLLPWLIRNHQNCGNPVFPFATGLFGLGHWDARQAATFAKEHAFVGSFADRIGAALGWTRGLLHPQWALLAPAAVLGCVVLFRNAVARRAGLLLAICLALSFAAWLMLTHVQSRFLLAALPFAAIAAGALPGLIRLGASDRARPLTGAWIIALALSAAWCGVNYTNQSGGEPARAALDTPADFTGETFRATLSGLTPGDRVKKFAEMGPVPFCNLGLPPGPTLYLLGDATPFYYTVPVVYNTTWDRSPLGDAMRRLPGTPADAGQVWLDELRAAGITHVLVNYLELRRYQDSGYADPLITPELVAELFARHGAGVRAWPDAANPMVVLYRIGSNLGELPRLVTAAQGVRP